MTKSVAPVSQRKWQENALSFLLAVNYVSRLMASEEMNAGAEGAR